MTILQVAHITQTPGPVQSLSRFIGEEKKGDFYRIYHPLSGDLSYSSLFKNGQLLKKKKIFLPGPAKYFETFFTTLGWLKFLPKEIDLAIGMNCFDTAALLVAKKVRTKKLSQIIFFNTDFSRHRFQNLILEKIYLGLDRFSAKEADFLCVNTQRTVRARIKEGIKKDKIIYTPNGVFLKDIGIIKEKKEFSHELVYVGRLDRDHDLKAVFRALSKVDLKLFIIGSGPEEENLRRLAKKYRLKNRVFFLGRKNHPEVIRFLKNFSGFGLAPYSSQSDWTYYADPVKIKEYLACLVPPITNNITEIARLVKSKRLGFVYQNNLGEILPKVASLNNKDYQGIIRNITRQKLLLDYAVIYRKIFKANDF